MQVTFSVNPITFQETNEITVNVEFQTRVSGRYNINSHIRTTVLLFRPIKSSVRLCIKAGHSPHVNLLASMRRYKRSLTTKLQDRRTATYMQRSDCGLKSRLTAKAVRL